jgi:hypothetical protein
MLNLNDAEPQRSGDLIPDGTFAKLAMALRRGGSSLAGADPQDAGLFKASNQPGSDVLSLDAEFTVIEGPHAKRKFWQTFTVAGGKRNEKGESMGWNITKSMLRAMIESAFGIDVNDMSERAVERRRPPAFSALDGLTFAAKIEVEPSDNPQYPAKNRLERIVTPDQEEWRPIMDGRDVSAKPRQRSSGGGRTPPAQGVPAWQAPATAPQPAAGAAWQQPRPAPQPAPTPQPSAADPAVGPAWLTS